MKLIIFVLILLFSNSVNAQRKFISIVPGDCSNCLSAVEFLGDKNKSTYILNEVYAIDSSSLREKYSFLKSSPIVFSDSLFEVYSLNNWMTISNENATLKHGLANLTKKASINFEKWNSSKAIDTLEFSYPISKRSISKRIFTEEGKLFLLNQMENNVICFDILEDRVLYIIDIPEEGKVSAYSKFTGGNLNEYNYYKEKIEPYISDAMCTIKDITVDKDSIYLSISNYFFFTGGKTGSDTFLTQFQSIIKFSQEHYVGTYVPSSIKMLVADTSREFFSVVDDIYVLNGNLYTKLYKGMYYKGSGLPAVGKFSFHNKSLKKLITLPKESYNNYDYSNPFFSNKYCILPRSTNLYDLESNGEFVSIPYFKHELIDANGIYSEPKYLNNDLLINDSYILILYNALSDNVSHIAKIHRKSHQIIANKRLENVNTKLIKKIDPYSSDFILEFFDNNKIIRKKILD